MKKNNKNNSEPPTQQPELTEEGVLMQCGQLGYSLAKTAAVMRSLFPFINKEALLFRLQTFGTGEHTAYHEGKATGDFLRDSALLNEAAKGNVEAQKLLREVQADDIITNAINEKFFPAAE